jgi:pectate lyase
MDQIHPLEKKRWMRGARFRRTKSSGRLRCLGRASASLLLIGLFSCHEVIAPAGSALSNAAPPRAFPEAQGWGATALADCRSMPLQVHQVTSPERSGPGTWSQVLSDLRSDHYDIVIFRTGGIIQSGPQTITQYCVYIAGQTAPGDGVTLGESRLRVTDSRDLVIRFLRLRGANGMNMQIIGAGGAQRIVLDHISASWSPDNNFGIWRQDGSADDTRDVSWQRSIAAEGLHPHSIGLIIGGNDESDAHEGVFNISVHHNLFAHNNARNPEVRASSAQSRPSAGVEVINNVGYNWNWRAISTRNNSVVDLIGNYHRPGPMTTVRFHRHMMFPGGERPIRDAPYPDASLHLRDNVIEGEEFHQQWDMIRQWHDLDLLLPEHFQRSTPLPQPRFPVAVRSAYEAFEAVLGDVGANAKLDCDGVWVPNQDPVDARLIASVLQGTGWQDSPPLSLSEAGAWPIVDPGIPCPDLDGDGLPDAWETRYFGCPTCADASAPASEGYLVIEHYLNGTTPH